MSEQDNTENKDVMWKLGEQTLKELNEVLVRFAQTAEKEGLRPGDALPFYVKILGGEAARVAVNGGPLETAGMRLNAMSEIVNFGFEAGAKAAIMTAIQEKAFESVSEDKSSAH